MMEAYRNSVPSPESQLQDALTRANTAEMKLRALEARSSEAENEANIARDAAQGEARRHEAKAIAQIQSEANARLRAAQREGNDATARASSAEYRADVVEAADKARNNLLIQQDRAKEAHARNETVHPLATMIRKINLELAASSVNGLRHQAKQAEVNARLAPLVGTEVTWSWRVRSIEPAGEHIAYQDRDVRWPRARIILQESKLHGGRFDEISNDIHLVQNEGGLMGNGADYLMVGLDCSEEYASKISAGDDILVRGTITVAELCTFDGTMSDKVAIRFANAVVVESRTADVTQIHDLGPNQAQVGGLFKFKGSGAAHEARKARAAYLIQYITRTGNAIDLLTAHGENPKNYWKAIMEVQNELLDIYRSELPGAADDPDPTRVLQSNIAKITRGREFARNALNNCP